jgi:beta-glucosidase
VRDGWGFAGYVVSDCDAISNLTEYQHYTVDAAHGAAAALNAGVDMNCGHAYAALVEALKLGLVSTETIDRSLHRLLLERVRLGMLDAAGCSPYERIGAAENDTEAHRALALRAAEESVVLLKNDGILPLKARSQSIAVVGPTADTLEVLEANYHGTASRPVTALDGLREAFGQVRYAQGSVLAAGASIPVPRTALRTSSAADATEGLTAEYFDGPSFRGKATLTAVVPRIDFDIDRAPPDPRMKSTHFAARWTGMLIPPAAGDYVLHVHVTRCWDCSTGHDSFRLMVDGKVAIDNDGSSGQPDKVMLHFADPSAHSIRLELLHGSEDEGIELEWEPPAEALLGEAIAAAREADVIVACVGLSPDLEGEALQVHLEGFAGGDRTSLELPASQRELLRRLQELGKPMVVVLNSGSAVALETSASAVLAAWYPGEEGGQALANILSGRTSPSGRLPVTFYRSVADLPAFSDYSMERRTYRYFDGAVLYPFGFGLSYTRFVYSQPVLARSVVQAGQNALATATVRNAGSVASVEVAELYIVPPQGTGMPRLALAGTRRVRLAPGESRTLRFKLAAEQMSFVDADGHRAVRAGTYRVFIGGAQPDVVREKGSSLRVRGEVAMNF